MVLPVLRKLRRAGIGRSAPNPRSSSLASSSVFRVTALTLSLSPSPKLGFVGPKLGFERILTGVFGGHTPSNWRYSPYYNMYMLYMTCTVRSCGERGFDWALRTQYPRSSSLASTRIGLGVWPRARRGARWVSISHDLSYSDVCSCWSAPTQSVTVRNSDLRFTDTTNKCGLARRALQRRSRRERAGLHTR